MVNRGVARAATLFVVVLALIATSCSSGGGDGATSGSSTTALVPAGAESTTSAAAPTTTTTAAASTDPTAPRPTAGCGLAPDPGSTDDPSGDVTQTITSGGQERTYRLAVPGEYDPEQAYPLVFNFHGNGSTASQQTVYSALPALGHERGLVVVTPDGIGGRWLLSSENEELPVDVQLVQDLIDDIGARYCIDQARTYAAGMSLGALMSAAVACALPGTFAAIGLVTVEIKPVECEPVPMVAFHGTEDLVVPYGPGPKPIEGSAEGVDLQGTLANMADWAELNGCSAAPTDEPIGADVIKSVYEGCAAGQEVTLYTVSGGGHTWPGSPIKVPFGATTDTINASEIILDLFSRHPG